MDGADFLFFVSWVENKQEKYIPQGVTDINNEKFCISRNHVECGAGNPEGPNVFLRPHVPQEGEYF